MTKKIMRIAAPVLAAILLVCISFAALAEGTDEIFDESIAEVIEIAADGTDTPTDEIPEAPAASAETAEAETIPADDADDGEMILTDDEDDEDCEIIEMSDDAGSVDPELVQVMVPEVTEEVKASSEAILEGNGSTSDEIKTDGEVSAEAEEETVITRAWIGVKDGQEIYFGETTTLEAKAEPELTGKVTWEIRDEQWEEEIWEPLGDGRTLDLEVTEAIESKLVRIVLEDGTISETFRVNATEREAEEIENADAADEQTEVRIEDVNGTEAEAQAAETVSAGMEETAAEAAGEDTAAQAAEETAGDAGQAEETADAGEETAEAGSDESEEAEPVFGATRAWITASAEGGLQPGSIVTLTANADPEMTGVNTWQVQDAQDAGAWQKIGYGDQMMIEITEEGFHHVYRFVMQDGFVSEPFVLGAEEAEEAAEPEITVPEDAKVSFVISWDDTPAIGATAHFTSYIEGLEGYGYTMQWQWSADGIEWQDLAGETEAQMDLVVTEENMGYYWRINVTLISVE